MSKVALVMNRNRNNVRSVVLSNNDFYYDRYIFATIATFINPNTPTIPTSQIMVVVVVMTMKRVVNMGYVSRDAPSPPPF